jgi:benzodiazapine receptor
MSYSTTSPMPVLVERRRPLDAMSLVVLAVFLLISAAVAVFGALTTISTVDGWYADAEKVAWSPPNWLFGPVWTTLYAAMAVAAWLVWRCRHFFYVGPALTLYVGQLFLNSVWTPVIVVLDICVAATIVAFWHVSRPAAILLMPYLVWILYATTLNLGLAVLNA